MPFRSSQQPKNYQKKKKKTSKFLDDAKGKEHTSAGGVT